MLYIESLLVTVYNVVWGTPLIIAILSIGLYFSYRLRIFSKFKFAMKYVLEKNKSDGDISVFASLCTALSATIGTGNIVGIVVAITLGGPGALLWLWVSSIVSFSIKYAEGVLAIKYRSRDKNGQISGGPMYYIELGLRNKKFAKVLAKVFAISGIIVASVGIGTMAQSNSIAVALSSFGLPLILTAVLIVIGTAAIILGGLKRIASVAEKIVPIMTVFYVGAAIIVLIINFASIPHAFYLIFRGAFSPESILGGSLGITVSQIASIGASRGIYAHESGLGSSAIAEATGKVSSPVKQGLTSMGGAILSIIVCTMTGLVLIITCNDTNIFCQSLCTLQGPLLTSSAFGYGLGIAELGKYIVGIGITLFAFTTIIGWNYYGEKCTQYIFGDKAVLPYKLVYLFFVAAGPFWNIKAILTLADILTGFMAISNLIGLVCLRKVVIEETRLFFQKPM